MSSGFLPIELFQYLALAWIGYVLWRMKLLADEFMVIHRSSRDSEERALGETRSTSDATKHIRP
jgi:hypothetical protein